ncbi:MAG: Cell division protein FtsA [Myxococcota bacterium]|nr:Cell division protein FtsA [Myxococcota bacterium]
MLGLGKGKSLLGLDIGSHAVKMVQLKPTKKGFALVHFGIAPLSPESIIDGAIMNAPAVVDVIRDMLQTHKIKTREAAIAVSGHSVIIKKINLPVMTAEELEESIQWEAEQYIPFDINDVNIDVQILRPESAIQGQMEVLLVAAKKEMISDYTAVVGEAGLQAVLVDVASFAVQNQFEVNYEAPKGETVVLINLGASVININILNDGITTFTRDINMGGNLFTEEVQKQLNISYDEAEALKLGGQYGKESDAVIPQEVEKVIGEVSQNVASEIQRSLDFYSTTTADNSISKIYLSGGTSKIPALYKLVEKKLGVPVEVMNPFRNIEVDAKKFDPGYLQEMAPLMAVATGLALRRVGDK